MRLCFASSSQLMRGGTRRVRDASSSDAQPTIQNDTIAMHTIGRFPRFCTTIRFSRSTGVYNHCKIYFPLFLFFPFWFSVRKYKQTAQHHPPHFIWPPQTRSLLTFCCKYLHLCVLRTPFSYSEPQLATLPPMPCTCVLYLNFRIPQLPRTNPSNRRS